MAICFGFLNGQHHAMRSTERLLRKHNKIFHWYVAETLALQHCVQRRIVGRLMSD